MRRVQSGQAGQHDVRPAERTSASVSFENFGDWTDRDRQGRAAARQAAAAAGRRAQHRRHAARLDEREAVPARPDLERPPATRRSTPTGRSIGSPEYSSDMMPILDPVEERRDDVQGAGARSARCRSASGPATRPALDAAAAVAVLGQRSDLGHARQQPQLDVRTRRPAVAGRVGARRRQPGVLQGRARIIRRPRLFPMERAVRHLAVLDPKTKKYTFVDTCFGTHHPQFGYDANDTLWTSGGGPVVGWLNTKMFDADRRRREVAGLDGARARHQRQRQARRLRRAEPAGRSGQGQAHQLAGFYAVMPSPVDGSIWGVDAAAIPARSCASMPGSNPPETALAEIYNVPLPGFGVARRRHRQQGRGLGVARQRPHRQLRSPQVQGAAQRPEGHRRSLPRGLDVPPVSRARASRASARTAPSRATTRGSTSTTRSGSATTCRCRPAT